MLRNLDNRFLHSRHTYNLVLRSSYILVQRCCTFPHDLIKSRTARSTSSSLSPSPCSALAVPVAKILNPPPPVVVVISNALRSVVLKPLLPPMSDSAVAGHMSNLMKLQQPPALLSHLLRVGGPFSARAALLPPLQKPTLHPSPCRGGGGVPLLPAAAAAAAATATATARRQFSTSPASSTDPVPQGSTPPSFPAAVESPAVNQGGGEGAPAVISSEASNGESKDTHKPFWHFERRVFWALYLFYVFFRSVAAVDIRTFPPTNRKIIFSLKEELGEMDKIFHKLITCIETLPTTDHYSCKVRSMLEGILSNMDKVIKQLPQRLNGIKWEIVVGKVPGVCAISFYNGKIIINPSLLQCLETDGKLTFVIGHEVAHIIAQHRNENNGNKHLGEGLIAFMAALCIVYSPQPFTFLWIPLLAIFCLFIRQACLSQRQELEADYVGMLLSASAGYDPREAPKFFTEVAWKVSSRILSFLDSHPPDEKRAKALLQNTKMEKALAIYKNN